MAFLLVAVCALLVGAASAAECVPEAAVGSCLYTGCFMDHGPAHCHTTTCMCDPGYCSEDGSYCKEAVTTLPPTTTNFVDRITDQVDTCGVKEYMREGSFMKAVGTCVAVNCRSWFWQSSVTAKCCSLQCTADAVEAGLPQCWSKLQPLFEKQAKAFGTTGKRRRAVDICQLGRRAGASDLSAEIVKDSEMEVYIQAAMTEFTVRTDATHGTLACVASGGLLAVLVAVGLSVRSRNNHVSQPPLLA